MIKKFKWLIIYFCFIMLFLVILTITDSFDIFKKYQLLFSLLLSFIFIPFLYLQYKKNKLQENKISNYFFIFTGIILSLSFNSIVYMLNKLYYFTNLYDLTNFNFTLLISNGVIGPIIEELMFRGIIYNNLKEKYPIKKSKLITTSVFAIFHFNLIQVIYAFILGYFLINYYEKYKNIKVPIILHMVSNITTLIVVYLLNK